MHCLQQLLDKLHIVHLVVPEHATEQSLFKFADFIAALALLVIVYTVSDIRYRFRLAIAPTKFHLYVETFVLIGVIGFGTLFTDLWASEGWLVPESLISASLWRWMFAVLFLSLAMTWMWYAFIKPPTFGRNNFYRFAQELYGIVIRGSSEELSIISVELSRSARSLVRLSRCDQPSWLEQANTPEIKTEPDAADIAHDILLLLGNRKLCRFIVEYSSWTAIAFFEAAAKENRGGLPLGTFAKNLSSEAIRNKDSILYHEDRGYNAGLTGYLKTFSRAIYGNYPLVEELGSRFGSPLDVEFSFDGSGAGDAEQLEAYCRAILITLEDYLDRGYWGRHSYVLFRAIGNLDSATSDLYKLNGLEEDWYRSDISKRLQVCTKFLREAIGLLGRTKPFPSSALKVREGQLDANLYDTIARKILRIILAASAVRTPFDTSWMVQHNMVWGEFFRDDGDSNRAMRVTQFKLRRAIYDEICRMDKFVNFKSARILGICLNVMGLAVLQRGQYGRSYRPLHRAILAWTRRNFLRINASYPVVAQASLMGGLTIDFNEKCLVKTDAEMMGRPGFRTCLALIE